MSIYTPGTMLRNGLTDSAIVLKDGTVFELKRDSRSFNSLNKDQRRTFADVASWHASLSNAVDITTDEMRSPKAPLTSRVFQYTASQPHSQIALDLLKHFKSNTQCKIETVKQHEQYLLKAKISLLKLELTPPVFDDRSVVGYHMTVEDAKEYFTLMVKLYEGRIAEYSGYNNGTAYYPVVVHNPKVFVKCRDEMVPLGVDEASGHIVLNLNGYKSFADAPCGPELPEFWALWGKKLTKLNVSVVPNVFSLS